MSEMFAMAFGNAMKEEAEPYGKQLAGLAADPSKVSMLIKLMGGSYGPTENAGIAPGGASPGTPVDPGPAAATIVHNIPYVEDGHVIRAQDYNSLLAALRLMAQLLDTGEITREITVSAAPVLLPVGAATKSFQIDDGFARGPAPDAAKVEGWLPLDLPDGYTIDSLRLLGRYPAGVGDWPLSLRRVPHGKQDDETIINGNLVTPSTTFGGEFEKSFAFDARGLARAAADELSLVDTGKYRYLLHTTVNDAKPTADLKIYTVQVVCVRG